MSDRLRLGVRVPYVPLLILVASLLVAPGRPAGVVVGAACAGSTPAVMGDRPDRPTVSFSAPPTTFAVPRVNALPSEIEEQDGVEPLDGPRVLPLSFLSFHRHLDSRACVLRPNLSHYPLLC